MWAPGSKVKFRPVEGEAAWLEGTVIGQPKANDFYDVHTGQGILATDWWLIQGDKLQTNEPAVKDSFVVEVTIVTDELTTPEIALNAVLENLELPPGLHIRAGHATRVFVR